MRCVIIGESVIVFARAIHCLAKIGHEIYIEPLKKGLSLRTVNSTRSAYACFIFMTSFFQTYDDGIPDDESEGLKCKLSVKSFLGVFKSLSTIERMVERCSISMKDDEQLTFLLYCRHGITKTYNLAYQDCESLQAVFTRDLSPNMINIQPRILGEVAMNFHNIQEEISLAVCPQNMTVTNYIEEDEDPAKVIHTKIVLVAEEFEKFQIGVDTEVTFCLKELKSIILFADSSGQNMDIHFESAGKPIVFSLTSDPTFEANFVLATLIDLPGTQGSQQRKAPNELEQKSGEATKRQSASLSNKASTSKERQQSPTHSEHMVDDEFGFDGEEDWANEILAAEKQGVQKTLARNNGDKHPDFHDSFQFQDASSRTASASSQERTGHPVKHIQSPPRSVSNDLVQAKLPGSMSVDSENSPGIAVRSGQDKPTRQAHKEQKQVEIDFVSDEQLPDSIPGTPPSKKFKSMFFSAMSETKNKTTIKQSNTTVVLVEDSDEESD